MFQKGEKGFYVDFTSLYPDILEVQTISYRSFKKNYTRFDSMFLKSCDGNCVYEKCEGTHWTLPYFGVIKATFKPPTNLLLPILPVRCNGNWNFHYVSNVHLMNKLKSVIAQRLTDVSLQHTVHLKLK